LVFDTFVFERLVFKRLVFERFALNDSIVRQING